LFIHLPGTGTVLTGKAVTTGKVSKLIRLCSVMHFSWGVCQGLFAWDTVVACEEEGFI